MSTERPLPLLPQGDTSSDIACSFKQWSALYTPSQRNDADTTAGSLDNSGFLNTAYYATACAPPARLKSKKRHVNACEVEKFRESEYPQLKGKVYLDTGGTMLYAKSLIERYSTDLVENLYGNPHSASTPSAIAGHKVEAAREKALRFFNADPNDWDLIFTANATASIKMVAECMSDYARSSNMPFWYGYHRDAHTSLVGVRELLPKHHCFVSDSEVDAWINMLNSEKLQSQSLGLFAYPAQSNMTGRRLPLSWSGRIRQQFFKAPIYTLLDAAALVSTANLDLSNPSTAPDFIALSFYKIFGFPDLGALIVRKSSAHVLKKKRFFGGGTVDMVVAVNGTWHAKKDVLHESLEDGTLPFHAIIALDHAIDVHTRLYGPNPMEFISSHTARLGRRLFEGLSSLRHANGEKVVVLYTDSQTIFGGPKTQGATIALNIRTASGEMIGYQDVEKAANLRSIFIRSGHLCNPGGLATYLAWSPGALQQAYAAGHRCAHPTQFVSGKSTGVIRVSIGAMNIAADIDAFLNFVQRSYVNSDASVLPSRFSSNLFGPYAHRDDLDGREKVYTHMSHVQIQRRAEKGSEIKSRSGLRRKLATVLRFPTYE